MVIAREIQRADAGIRSLAEPYLDTTSDFAEIVLAILGVAAKLERRRIIERTARGRADAKAKGVKFGRKPTLTPHQQKEVRTRLEAGETQRSYRRSGTALDHLHAKLACIHSMYRQELTHRDRDRASLVGEAQNLSLELGKAVGRGVGDQAIDRIFELSSNRQRQSPLAPRE